MTDIYLHFLFAHYGLYGNAPVDPVWVTAVPVEALTTRMGFRLMAQFDGNPDAVQRR